MWKYYLALLGSTAMTAFAQVVIRKGVRHLSGKELDLWSKFTGGLASGLVWVGVGIMGVSLVIYIYSMIHLPVTIAAPAATGLGIVVVALTGRWLIGASEKLNLLQIAGFCVIIVGVWLVMRGKPIPTPAP
jgi:multidrug transporter EmrE-like cation transporter